MPVSKNKRKSKKAQSRKVNRARTEGNFGGGGTPPKFDHPPPPSPQGAIPELTALGTSIDENRQYQVNSPDDAALSETEQIDAITLRSVTFEMTEAHHDNIGLREIDLDGEISGGDILGRMEASIEVDPLATIEGHPRWQTGQELIDFLDSDPNVSREELFGNRWQGLGVPWVECLPEVGDCPYRQEEAHSDRQPRCSRCESGMRAEEVHFHILEDDDFVTLCQECWSKGPLP